jgi:hypothetical protein
MYTIDITMNGLAIDLLCIIQDYLGTSELLHCSKQCYAVVRPKLYDGYEIDAERHPLAAPKFKHLRGVRASTSLHPDVVSIKTCGSSWGAFDFSTSFKMLETLVLHERFSSELFHINSLQNLRRLIFDEFLNPSCELYDGSNWDHDLVLDYMPSLEEVRLGHGFVSHLSLKGLKKLRILNLSRSNYFDRPLDLSDLVSLETLEFGMAFNQPLALNGVSELHFLRFNSLAMHFSRKRTIYQPNEFNSAITWGNTSKIQEVVLNTDCEAISGLPADLLRRGVVIFEN